MQVAQHPSPSSTFSGESRQILTTMSTRLNQPLIFSIDDRLADQHLTRLDLCSKNLKTIDKLPDNINFNIILLDQNQITKLEYLDLYPQLIQLSISHNRLTDIRLLNRLRSLQKLNLSYNLIDSIDCLRNLQHLVMLNISNNNIPSIAVLNTCHALQSLDASENSIQQVEDLSQLTSLKYLNLHKNFLDTLMLIPRYWPKTLHTLVISNNEIQDLTEVSYLSTFINLNTLYINDNPCLSVVDERRGCYQPFDYRPFILNWCLSIHNLDGIFITRKESLKAEWLLSQGKGRSFSHGEHAELVQYLIRVCGTDADERDDLHLSRIMLQQEFYNQQKYIDDDQMMATSDTMRDANDTLSKNTQGNNRDISSSVSIVDEPVTSVYHQQIRTPSPGYLRPTSVGEIYLDDPITENSSSKRATNYDNRPIKPLDQNMFQSQLNRYPVNNTLNENTDNSRPRTSSNPKRASPNLVYNANRYSPKITTHSPTTSSVLSTKLNRNFGRQRNNRVKRQQTNSNNTNALRTFNHSHDKFPQRLTTTVKVKNQQQHSSTGTSNDYKNQHTDDDDDDDEIQLKSAPVDRICSTMDKSADLQKLTTSVETMRTSILQAYLDLHEKFTKTTELQTSALSALWKQCEIQSLTHQRETERIIQENRLLHQRIHDLETRLSLNESPSPPKQNPNLHPPLRAHISKRDTKSFYLHWIPNPLNEHHHILGYRIYIDDILKGSIDSGKFEAIIDYIRDEGEYKIKLRTFDAYGESVDSNIVVARFRRHSTTILNDNNNEMISPKEQNDIRITPSMISDAHISPHRTTNDNIISRKPPKSPSSSPNRTDRISPNKDLFSNDASATIPPKRSPIRSGIMSRLAKSPHINKHNNILLNGLPIQITNSPTEPIMISKAKTKTDLISTDHEQFPLESPDIAIHDLATNSDTSSPPPVPPRISKNTTYKLSIDE